MKSLRSLAAVVLLATVTACAQMGLQTPRSFDERLAAGYTTVQTIAEGAKAAYLARKISGADRDNVVASERTALDALDLTAKLHSSDPQAAETKLTATLAVLNALNAYVTTQGAKP